MKIGDILRTNREKRGLSLLDVENETKIRSKYLAALEAENFEEIPGEVYLLGFLRNYARYLDLNPEELISQYKSLTKKNEQEIIPTSQSSTTSKFRISEFLKVGSIFKNKAIVAGIVLILVGGSLTFTFLGLAQNKKDSTPPPSLPSSREQQLPSLYPIQSEGVEVKLVGKELCWFKVKIDGEEEITGFVNPEETKRFQAQEVIWLRLGNAGGVTVFFNGKEIPPLGQRGDVIEKEFSKSSQSS
ncbi:MAG: helix-turn-helix domain-containing protein [Bacillota bacterium]|jgi:cytoskeletal protein RodZ|nr:helix-turn-helix domain-containing protein [Bacillota bacterium]